MHDPPLLQGQTEGRGRDFSQAENIEEPSYTNYDKNNLTNWR